MKLFELTQIIDEGPRQDRTEELFNEFMDIFHNDGPKAFRRKILDTLVAEFGLSMANASNLYNAQMKKSNIEGMSNTSRRAAAGKEPVKAWGTHTRGANLDDAPKAAAVTMASGDVPAGEKSEEQDDAEIRAMLHDTDKFDNITDEDDFEWDRVQDSDGNLVIEWVFQYSHSNAVNAIKQNHDEVSTANAQLASVGQKYRDRVLAYRPATLERAVKDDEMFKGKPETVRRLRGQLVLKM